MLAPFDLGGRWEPFVGPAKWSVGSVFAPTLAMLCLSQIDLVAVPVFVIRELGLSASYFAIMSAALAVGSHAFTEANRRAIAPPSKPSKVQTRGALCLVWATLLIATFALIPREFVDPTES